MTRPHTLGKYQLIAELGHGGMADVYLAMIGGPAGSGFTKLAVIKRLRSNLVEDPEFVAMLVDEARISARLNHPNVVQTIEVGVEGEEYYLAMEFLEGQPLHRIQSRAARTGMPIPRDLEYLIVADTLAGLHHAHELADYDGTPLGIVHRDVTPQNVFVTYDGTVKVVDFGIAKAAGRASETKQGIVKGKVRYMSPEQAVGQHIDRRSDLFAAGLLLWGAATGQRFWRDADDLQIIQTLVAGTFDPSPRSVDPMVPFEIDAICRKAMAANPADRYATAAEFHDDLEAFLADHIVSARRRLGEFVAKLFQKERAELRGVVERASRGGREQSSINVLMAQSRSSGAIVAAPQSLAPVNFTARPSSPVPAPREPRFGSGAILAAAGMVVAALLIMTQVRRADLDVSSGASVVAARETSQAADSRTELVMRSKANKLPAIAHEAVVAFAPAASPAPPPPPSAPRQATVAAPASPSTASAAASKAASSAPDVARPDGTRRRKPAIDTADPWGDSAN